MFGKKYRINPVTLQMEVAVQTPLKRWIIRISAGILILLTAVGMRVLYDYNAKSPRLVYYEKKNTELRNEYAALFSELRDDEQRLTEFRLKDDRMYRSLFGMDPLPSSIRDAGTGGASMHSSLSNINDPDLIIDTYDKLNKVLNKAKIQSSSFEDLEEVALTNQQMLAKKPLIQPISPADKFWLTSSFGTRLDPFTRNRKAHHGIDLAGNYGLEIHATGDGVVTIADTRQKIGYGKEVVIEHDFGYSSRYAHLQDIYVKEGQEVKRGQVIGTLGSTGRSTGPHLHYEVRLNNKAINPFYFFYEELSPEEYKQITDRASSN